MDYHKQRNELPQVVPIDGRMSTASEDFNRELKREKREKWIRRSLITAAVSALFASIFAGGYIMWRIKNSTVVVTNQTSEQKQQQATLYYAVQTGEVTKPERTWPTYTIYQRVAGQTAEKTLLKVGTEGEYPVDLVADKTGKYLAVNYETKLTVYNLADGKQKTSITAGTGLNFSRPVFSPDSSKVFSFEVTAPNNDKLTSLFATSITLKDDQQSREVITTETPALLPQAWTDDKILASEITNSEFTRAYTFDLKDKKATQLGDSTEGYVASADGKYIAVGTSLIDDAANCLGGKNPSGVAIIRVSDAKQVGSYTDSGSILTAQRFSANDTKLLVSYRSPVATGTNCSDPSIDADAKLALVNWTDQSKDDITEDKLDAKDFPKQLLVESEGAGDSRTNILKYGTETIRTTTAKEPMISLGIVLTDN